MKYNWKKQILSGTLAVAVTVSSPVMAFAGAAPDGKTDAAKMSQEMNLSDEWETWKTEWAEGVSTDWKQISLTPGSDESELNFAWYSTGNAVPKLVIGEGRSMKNAVTYTAAQTEATQAKDGTQYYSNKVTAKELKPDTVYYYKYEKSDGTWTKAVKYRTGKGEDFSFIYVGDPQIGSSNEAKAKKPEDINDSFYTAQFESVRSDTFNWETTLNQAMEMSGNQARFVLSAGDQIQTNAKKVKDNTVSEMEYAGYLSPDILKSLPVATTVGNHDADNPNYVYHFNRPNVSELGTNGVVEGDYYFTYGSALFIMLNTQDTNVAEHKQFIEQAVKAEPDCKWRIVTLHQDIYGSAEHSNEPEITNLRYSLVPYFEANDIDVVLTGHDHAYSRSQILKGGVKTTEYTDDEFDEQLEKDLEVGEDESTRYTAPGNIKNDTTDPAEKAYIDYLYQVMDEDAVEQVQKDGETVVNPEGILYMTANSSSGSKYYDLVPRMQTYIAARWQEDVPTYSVIHITDETFTINTYRTDNDEKIDETFTIVKTEKTQDTKPETKTDISTAEAAAVKNQVYTGKAITPEVKLNCQGRQLVQGTDYTVAYTNNKNTGLAAATITGMGAYTGIKTVNFKIVPKKAALKSVKAVGKQAIQVKLKKSAGKVSGYQIICSTDRKFNKAKKVNTRKLNTTVKSLKKATYYVKARAYTNIQGTKVFGAYSKTVKVSVK